MRYDCKVLKANLEPNYELQILVCLLLPRTLVSDPQKKKRQPVSYEEGEVNFEIRQTAKKKSVRLKPKSRDQKSHLMGEQVSPESTLASLRLAKRDLTLSLAARGCRIGPWASCRDIL
jgi:hypothetical protein